MQISLVGKFFATLALACVCRWAMAQVTLPCAYNDRECAQRVARDHPAYSLKFWQRYLARPLAQRIGAAPPELVEFLHLGMIMQGLPYRPRAASVDASFVRDVRDAIAELPEEIRVPLDRRLAGVFLVQDFWCCAWTDYVFDEERRPIAGTVVLNQATMNEYTANSWATWKENTPFAEDPRFRLIMEIAPPGEDNRKNLIQYLLLHELGHVFSIGNSIHPSWNVAPSAVRSTASFPYFNLSWTITKGENRYVTPYDANVFPQRKDIVYFYKPKLSAEQMIPVYDNLARTNLATLYAATHPGDDFAEAFVTYVHTVLLKKPFAVRIYRDGALAKTFTACWEEARCAEKRRIIEHVIRAENEHSAAPDKVR